VQQWTDISQKLTYAGDSLAFPLAETITEAELRHMLTLFKDQAKLTQALLILHLHALH
jgi:hypothetical protein